MIKPLLTLSRVSNLPTVWGNVICCAVIVASDAAYHSASILSVLALLVSLSCFYCGGMVLNDICDEDYDREHQNFRPLPSGLISRQQAIYFAAVLFFCAFATLILTPSPLGLLAGVCLLGVIVLYNLQHKQHSLSVLLMAAARSLVYIVSGLSLTGEISLGVALIATIQGAYVLLVTAVARFEKHTAAGRYSWPVIPWLIAAIALIDGIFLAFYAHPFWLGLGFFILLFTRFLHRFIRGD